MNRPSYNRAIADDQTQNLHVFSLLLFVLINLSCNRATDSALSSKSVLRFHLQLDWSADCGGSSLSILRLTVESYDRSGGNEL